MFGVPEEIYSGGGPSFSSAATADFLTARCLWTTIDGLLCALLQACNTPDPDCNNQHRWYLAGPFALFFSFISRCINYNNPSIHPTWRDAWSQKEDAMRTRIPRCTEALDMHIRLLAPLSIGDKVFLQNQRGSHPKKLDKSGTVAELGNYDQYRVKVDGSGRLSLRNMRFFRRHPPHRLNRLRYLHQYPPNHPPVFAQDDSLNHVATTYQKLVNAKKVDVRGAIILSYTYNIVWL